jgi:hypothetical protein
MPIANIAQDKMAPTVETTHTPKIGQSGEKWAEAIRDAEEKITRLERERARLKIAVRLMKRQIKEGAPWPGSAEATRGSI